MGYTNICLGVTCQVSCVKYCIAHVTRCISLTKTARATEPPSSNSASMHSRMLLLLLTWTHQLVSQNCKLWDQCPFINFPYSIFLAIMSDGTDKQTEPLTWQLLYWISLGANLVKIVFRVWFIALHWIALNRLVYWGLNEQWKKCGKIKMFHNKVLVYSEVQC